MKCKKIISMLLVASSLVMACSACSKEETSDSVDINSEHIALELLDKVKVDADITPYDKYKDGMNSYYVTTYIDAGDIENKEDLIQNAKFFRQDMQQVINYIEENIDGNFDWENREIIFDENTMQCEINVPHVDNEGIQRRFHYIWYIDELRNIINPEVWFGTSAEGGEASMEEHNMAYDVQDYILECRGQDLSFASAMDVVDEYKEKLELIMGEELSDSYICVPVSKENYDVLIEKELELFTDFDEEFYRCVYYPSVDGFPYKLLNNGMNVDEAGELAAGVEKQILGTWIRPVDEWPLVVDVDKNGIRFLELTSMTELGDIYREKEQVIDANQLLENLKNYFGASYQTSEITIYNMELCYGGYFTDKEDGPIRNITSPFWVVDYCIEDEPAGRNLFSLVYDAYTGEFIQMKEAE